MRKLVGYILTPIFFFSFGFIAGIFHPIQWVAYNVFGYTAHKRTVDIMNFLLTYSQLWLGNSISVNWKTIIPRGMPIIFVANHQSLYDVPGLIWFLREYHVKFISKIELTKGIPSVSFNLKYGGGANIDRKDSKQAVSEIIKLGRRMKEKAWSTLIFAEGTRSRDGNVKTFQVGGIATLLKVVPEAIVVPVAIENSWKIVRWGKFPLGTFLCLKWTVLPPVVSEGVNPEVITLEVENTIKAVLGQKPNA